MSLINDALKKAQRQRGDSNPPSPSAPSAAPMPGPLSAAPSRRATPASRPQLLLLGVGTLLGLALALGAVFLLRQPEPPASATPPAAASVAPEPARTAAAEPAASLPVTASSPTPAKAEEAPLLTVSTRPSEPAPVLTPAASPATPATPPRASLTMIQTIEAFRIAGVRASGPDSKVLMNDRVYRIGDTVDHALGIRISAVTANSITFVDEAGAAYTRNF